MNKKISGSFQHAWVYFIPSKSPLLNFFYRGGHGHAFILMQLNDNWITIDPRPYFISIQELGNIAKNVKVPDILLKSYKKIYPNVKMIEVRKPVRNLDKHKFPVVKLMIPRLNNCVSFIKYFFDLKGLIFIPSQLYKRLLKGETNGW